MASTSTAKLDDGSPKPLLYDFPPFYTYQSTVQTRKGHWNDWSEFIQSYCRHNRIFVLVLADALETPLFFNKKIDRRLLPNHAKELLDWMSSPEGGGRIEWISSAKETCYVYWRTPDEWATILADWVEETGQKNTVLTLYELTQGDNTLNQDFHDMDQAILTKALQCLVKRGKAQIFGEDGQQGVKLF